MQKALFWMLIGFILFAILVTIIFSYLSSKGEESKQNLEAIEKKDISTFTDYITKAERDSIINLNHKKDSIISVKAHINDSLEQIVKNQNVAIKNYKQRLKELKKQIPEQKSRANNIKNLAKTYEKLRVTEMKPILKNIDDTILINIYNQMSSRKRQKILQALSPKRAAQLTDKLAN